MVEQRGSEALLPLMFHVELQKVQEQLVVLGGFAWLGLCDTTVGEEHSQEEDVGSLAEGRGADTLGQKLHLAQHYAPEACLIR